MPMVVMKEGVKESSLKRSRQHDLPTPLSPMSRSLILGGVSQGRDEGCDRFGVDVEGWLQGVPGGIL